MTTVLVTGAGALLGQGIIRALQRSSLGARIVAVDPSPQSAGLFWADAAHLVPFASDPSYLDRLRALIDREKVDAVLVGTDVELEVFASNRSMLEREHSTHVLVSSPEVVGIADDKYATAEFFRTRGFDYPHSALPEHREDLEALIRETGFPLIVKPRRGARSIGVSKVASKAELLAAIAGREGLVVQECVGGDDAEYTASALVFDGEPMASIVMRRDLRDGNTYRAFTEPAPELNALTMRWGGALQPYGPANFQFRIDAQGRAKVFEINGRFSGTTPLRALVGFNEVEICLRHVLFGEPVAQPVIENAAILRHWSETKVSHDRIEALA